MTPELLRFGLGISRKLDQRFGLHTIGAKMTDVPGHTRAIVPELARAGVKFLHIGVNPASMPPDVPSLFRWRWDTSMERSWEEQRDYVRRAAAAFEEKTGRSGLLPAPVFPDCSTLPELPAEEPVRLGDFRLQFDSTGAICSLTRNGAVLADENHPLAGMRYETFSAQQVRQFKEDYLSDKADWALEDFGKLGMESTNVPVRLTAPS